MRGDAIYDWGLMDRFSFSVGDQDAVAFAAQFRPQSIQILGKAVSYVGSQDVVGQNLPALVFDRLWSIRSKWYLGIYKTFDCVPVSEACPAEHKK
jgi:hypothetical protein